MKTLLIFTALLCVTFLAACGNKTATNASNSSANTGASNKMTGTAPAPSGDSAASVVKKVYEEAIKRNCAAIPPLLTEVLRKETGTKDEIEAMCDVFSDSGKITSVDVKDEPISGDSGKVKVTQNYKDGTKKEKEENVKKENGKWLLDN